MRTAASAPRVLIVDDLDDMRMALRLLLEAEGVDVVGEAENGERGIEVARLLQPDVVVLDGLMPVMNGEDAAQILRLVAPGARIVAFSASLETQPRWADAFVPKDRLTDLFSAIEEIVAAA
ncbi:MAG: response regulator transcription factor [Actinomycetota bacterium]